MTYIMNSVKGISPETQKNLHFLALKVYEQAMRKYPEYFVAFDFVSYEDAGDLKSFANLVDEYFKDIKDVQPVVSYHAGESFQRSNQNARHAIQVGSRRLGHGLNLLRDPGAIRMAREKGVTIEACPLSNNLLGYVTDLNWHPVKCLKEFGVKIR